MTSSFPLYNTLLNDTLDKDLNSAQKSTFIKKLPTIDTNGMELMYTLIQLYSMNHQNNQCFPYDSVKDGNNITFNLELLPFQLKQILYKFLLLHIKTMDEDKNRME